jgi:hypothetical protein
MRITPLYERPLDHRAYYLRSTPDGRVIVAASREGQVTILGPDLVLLHTYHLRMPIEDSSVGPDGTTLVFSTSDRFLVTGIDGREVIHEEAGPLARGWMTGGFDDCLFSADGQTAWTACHVGDRRVALQRRQKEWRVSESVQFDEPTLGCHVDFVPHPEGRAFALWVTAGQDGQWVCWACDEGATLRVSPPLPLSLYTTAPTFHPAGGEFLVVEDFDTLRRYSFPDCQQLGTLTCGPDQEAEEEEDDPLGSFCYLADDRALLTFEESGRFCIVDLASMAIVEDITLDTAEAGRDFHSEEQVGPERIVSVYPAKDFKAADWKDVLVLWGGRPPFGDLTGPSPACPHTARLLEMQGWK